MAEVQKMQEQFSARPSMDIKNARSRGLKRAFLSLANQTISAAKESDLKIGSQDYDQKD